MSTVIVSFSAWFWVRCSVVVFLFVGERETSCSGLSCHFYDAGIALTFAAHSSGAGVVRAREVGSHQPHFFAF